jgi:hypothetical protein
VELTILNDVAKFKFIPNNKHYLYCEIYDDKYGVVLFTGRGFDKIKGPWENVRFNTRDNPITVDGLYKIILEYRREILEKIIGEINGK